MRGARRSPAGMPLATLCRYLKKDVMRQGMRALAAACIVSASCHAYATDTVGQVEASMLVTGTMTIKADGSMASYALDHAEKLPPEVGSVVRRSLPTWKFTLAKPGEAPLNESMSLRIVARAIDKDHATVRIAGARFGKHAGASEGPRSSRRPRTVVRASVTTGRAGARQR